MSGRTTASALALSLVCNACGDDGPASSASATGGFTGSTGTQGASASDSEAGTTAPTTGGSDGATGSTSDSTDSATGPDPGSTSRPDETTAGVDDSTTDADSDGGATGIDATSVGTTSGDTTSGDTTDGDTTDGDRRPGCGGKLEATVRDFSLTHPDFESFFGLVEGLVEPALGADGKPVHAAAGPTEVTSGPEAFAQWYNDVPGVNVSFTRQLELTEVAPGLFQYKNNLFFPIDGEGFGNEGNDHNFHFTTEIHTSFQYDGGEVFTFTGDDDLWIFINGTLAIDLGGVHPEASETIELDALAVALGIVPGNSYAMDIFHAERHTVDSNFRIDTTIACFLPQ